jgi:hypothetical protein
MLVRKPELGTPRTAVCTLLSATPAGRAVAAELLVPLPDGTDRVVTVYAFAGAAKARLLALGTNADRWATIVRVTATTNAKGYRNVKAATDVELLQLVYRPQPKPTFKQHLARYVHRLADRIA